MAEGTEVRGFGRVGARNLCSAWDLDLAKDEMLGFRLDTVIESFAKP